MRIAAFALLLTGCACPGPALHGIAAITLGAPVADGRVAAPGLVRSTEGRPRAAVGALSLDLLAEDWILAFRTDATVLPEEVESPGSRSTLLDTWELALGPRIVANETLRADAYAGGRLRLLRSADSDSGLPSDDNDREAWVRPMAGARAEVQAGKGVSFRFRGDGDLGNSEEDRAWRASAAAIFSASKTVALSLGWEMSSIHHDHGQGRDRFLYDVTISGPFVALELRF